MTSSLQASVIIPTHNRPDKLAATLASLMQQTLPASSFEVVVVDDGSAPPVVLPTSAGGVKCSLVRLEGVERSAARNAGAAAASGQLLIFVDDDMLLPADFLATYLQAHRTWPDALLVGSIRLPRAAAATPFGRFRQQLEDNCVPRTTGLTAARNFCAAGNMAIPRTRFLTLQGFDPGLSSSEDQDLALRHTATGGCIAFVAEAAADHCDGALDIRGYCRRNEWGSEYMIPFCQRYPDWPDNIERTRVNGPLQWRQEPLAGSLRKLCKAMLACRPVSALLLWMCAFLEWAAPRSKVLERCYRLALGAHIFRGYRKGLRRFGTAGADVSSHRPTQPAGPVTASGAVPCR